jgi:hypothetical protein
MNLHENIKRIKEVMGLIVESTDVIENSSGNIILVSDWVKNHIKEHNKLGVGSIFREGITDGEIEEYINMVSDDVSEGGGAYQVDVPNIGYNLVLPYDEAMDLPDAEETTTEKKEGPNVIEVPMVKTSEDVSSFSTNILTLIIRPSNPNFLPDDVKGDENVLNKINEGKCFSLLTAFPGDPNIPRASEWVSSEDGQVNKKYAVVMPSKNPTF